MLNHIIIAIISLQLHMADENAGDSEYYEDTIESPLATNLSDKHELLARRTFIDNCCGQTKCPGLTFLSDVYAFADTDDEKMMDSLRMATKYSRSRIITIRPYRNLVFAVKGPPSAFKRQLTPRLQRISTRRRRTTNNLQRRRRRRTTTPTYYDDYYDDTTTSRRKRRSTSPRPTSPAYYDDEYYEDEKTTRRRRSTTQKTSTKIANSEAEYYEEEVTTRRRRTTTRAPEYYEDDYYEDTTTTRKRRTRSTATASANLTLNVNATTDSMGVQTVTANVSTIRTSAQDDGRKEETSSTLAAKDTKKPEVDDDDP